MGWRVWAEVYQQRELWGAQHPACLLPALGMCLAVKTWLLQCLWDPRPVTLLVILGSWWPFLGKILVNVHSSQHLEPPLVFTPHLIVTETTNSFSNHDQQLCPLVFSYLLQVFFLSETSLSSFWKMSTWTVGPAQTPSFPWSLWMDHDASSQAKPSPLPSITALLPLSPFQEAWTPWS